MSTNSSKLFNKQFSIFIKDVNKLVQDTDDKLAQEQVDSIVKQYALVNLLPDDYMVNNFIQFIQKPYSEYIYKKDANFFLNNEYTVEDTDYAEYNNTIVFLTQVFKKMWGKLDADTTDKIWTRLQILTKLCEKHLDEKSS